jgi:RNA polymerase sigma-70 factor (ECF subfamily)
VTDSSVSAHSPSMIDVLGQIPAAEGAADGLGHAPFEAVYEAHFAYVWRSVQRLGIPERYVDDIVQEVFVIVHRKLEGFEGRSSLKTWIYGIALRVARAHGRKSRLAALDEDTELEGLRAPASGQPDAAAERTEAARTVNRLLDGLDEDQREVFVLAELEQLTAPEIAEALEVKLNTVYSRLRLARAAFAEAAARHRLEEKRSQR